MRFTSLTDRTMACNDHIQFLRARESLKLRSKHLEHVRESQSTEAETAEWLRGRGADAVVDPGAVVVHLHDAPRGRSRGVCPGEFHPSNDNNRLGSSSQISRCLLRELGILMTAHAHSKNQHDSESQVEKCRDFPLSRGNPSFRNDRLGSNSRISLPLAVKKIRSPYRLP